MLQPALMETGMLYRWTALALAATAALTGNACAENAKGQENDASAISTARVPLAAAVTTAEQHVHGKAVRARFSKPKTGPAVYLVEVAGASGAFDVKVDADNGTVIAATADKADNDDNDD